MGAYRAALDAGMTDSEFWASTPYLTKIAIESAGKRARMAYRQEMFGAWHAAGLSRIKRMPSLDKALRPFDGPRQARRQTPEEMLRVIEQWNAALGGRDTRKAN